MSDIDLSTDPQYRTEKRDGFLIEWDVPIRMEDGLVLRANVYRPDDDSKYPVILSYGPYAKDLAWQDGYETAWELFAGAHPDAIEGSSNVHQSWEVVDPGEMGAGRLHLRARGFARRRPLAGLYRPLLPARDQGFRHLHRLGRASSPGATARWASRESPITPSTSGTWRDCNPKIWPPCASGRDRPISTAT